MTVALDPAAAPATDRTRPLATPTLPLWAALVVAAASGPVLDAAFPDHDIWPLAFLGIGMVLVALQGRRFGTGLLVGFVSGAAFYFLHIEWATTFLGVVPWAALSTLMALWCALGGALITLAFRWVPRAFPTLLARLLFVPVVVAGLWTAREAIASVWPYGGFSWGRVAFSQSGSPISGLFAWLGVSGVSFAMVFAVAVAIAAWQSARAAATVHWSVRATLVVGIATLLVVFPAWPALTQGTIRVGAVQGDAKAGYFDQRQLGDNLADQVAATVPVYGKKVDVVVWPEGGSDLDPYRDPYAAKVFDAISSAAKAPLVSGIITTRFDGPVDPTTGEATPRYFNTSVVWHAGTGPSDYYDKKHPVPFGEYVPDRAFWRQFAPDLIDLIQREYSIGTTDEVMDVGNGKPGDPLQSIQAGIAICFDIVDDQLMTDMVNEGAQVVLAQTNNADFGHTDESVQQLAIARIRAIELGRSVVNISTVGTSAVITPDGTIIDQLPTYTPGVMIDDVPLGTSTTPAVVISRFVEWLVCGIAFGALLAAGTLRPRRR